MCVIILIPQGKEISYEEFEAAWEVNPDGAGFAIRTPNNRIYYKRGFMKIADFYSEVCKYMGEFEMMLHFRISTSRITNKVQTHPYNIEQITSLQGLTTHTVSCMNGTIKGQKEYIIDKVSYNDTMSYIYDNNLLFKDMSQQITDIISEDSGAKWCSMSPKGTFFSNNFIEKNGIYYSNDNHLRYMEYMSYLDYYYYEYDINDLINKKVYKNIKKDKKLINEINSFIHKRCNNFKCNDCTKCLSSARTIRDIKISLKENK